MVMKVKKALAAVWRIVDKNNVVQFGPRPEHNHITSLGTGRKVHVKQRRTSYVLHVEFVKRVRKVVVSEEAQCRR